MNKEYFVQQDAFLEDFVCQIKLDKSSFVT